MAATWKRLAFTTELHNALTLDDAAIEAVLDLDGQKLTLASQAANTFLRGPISGAAADPVFGALVAADLPAGTRFVPLPTLIYVDPWDGNAKTTADNGTKDCSAVFGLPAGIKAIQAGIAIVDGTVGQTMGLGANGVSPNYIAVMATVQVANITARGGGLVPCDANGDIYFYCDGNLDQVHIAISGYYI